MTNGCDNDALSDVTHTVGSFLKTINSLTEYAGQYVDTSRNLLVDIDKEIERSTKLPNGAMKKIITVLRDKITAFLSKRYRDFIGLYVTEARENSYRCSI